jgi:ATP-dependent helicase HrpB
VQHEGEAALAADLAALLEERDPLRGASRPPTSRCASTPCTATADADPRAVQAIRRGAALHRRRLGVHGNTPAEGDAGALLAAGFPDRIALKRGPIGRRLPPGEWARARASPPPTRWRRSACSPWRTSS